MGDLPWLVGRDAEQRRLREVLDATAAGHPGATLIHGEAGIGKTTLGRHLSTWASERGFHVLYGACLRFGADVTSFAPLSQALSGWLDDTAAELRARLFPAATTAGDVVPAFGGTREFEAGQVLFQLTSAVQSLCRDAPTLIVADDLHWADPSTLDALAYLITGMRGTQRLHLLATYRDTELPEGHRLHGWLADMRRMPAVSHFSLTPLDLWQTEQMVLRTVGGNHTAWAEEIYGRAGGNPYLTELLIDELDADGGAPAVTGLRDALLAAWHRLGPTARRSMQVLAVSGRPVSVRVLGELAQALGVRPDDLRAALAETAAHGVTVEGSSGVWFRHPLIAEVVGTTLNAEDRSRLVNAFASVWESATDVNERDRATHLALHYAAARNADRCFTWSVRAAEAAAAIGARQEEARHLTVATAQLPSLSARAANRLDVTALLLRAARAAEMVGEYSTAHALFLQALDRVDGVREPLGVVRVLLALAFLEHTHLGNAEVGGARLDEALKMTAAFPHSAERAQCLAYVAFEEVWTGSDGARRHADEAVSLAEQLEEPATLAWALAVRSQTGSADARSVAEARRAVSIAEGLDDTETYVRAVTCLTNALGETGQWVEAAEVTSQAYVRVRRDAAQVHVAWVGCLAAGGLFDLGRWDEAGRILREVLSFRQTHRWAVDARCLAALVTGFQGDFATASMHLHRAKELTPTPQAVGEQLVLTEIQLELLQRDPERALELVEQYFPEAMLIDPAMGADEYVLHATRAAADLAESDPHGTEPLARLQRIEALRGEQPPMFQTHGAADLAHAALAAVHAAERARAHRDLTAQAALWSRAVQATERAGLRYEGARASYFLARTLLVQRENRPAAADALRHAQREAADLGADPLLFAVEQLALQAHVTLNPRPAVDEPTLTGPELGHHLTPREREILSHIVAGETYSQIAASLYISEKTVSVHVSNLLRKTGTASRIELALRARVP